MRTRTRLTLTLGLVLAALTASLLPWWHSDDSPTPPGGPATRAREAATGPRDEAAAQAEARRTGKEVAVDTRTTPTSMTWARPDGQLHTTINAVPVRARNDKGRWAPIDTRLRRTGHAADGLGIRPVNAPTPVRFSSGTADADAKSAQHTADAHADRSLRRPLLTAGQGPSGTEQVTAADGTPDARPSTLAEVDVDGHTIDYTWPGPLPEPVLDGPRALYPEVLPGVDLLLVAREQGGFAQLLIVKTEKAAQSEALRTVSYGLRSKTATFRYEDGAQHVLMVGKDGQEIGSVPTPYAWDSSGRDREDGTEGGTAPRTSVATSADVLRLSGLSGIEPGAHSAPLPMRLVGDRTGQARIDLDVAKSGLLTDKNARFPLFIDPTEHTGETAWTTAYKPHPNTSYWNGTNFNSGTSYARVGHESETGGTARSFWRMAFDTSTKGATVSSASFKVYNNYSWSCSTREMQFWLTGSISSGTTWNKQPSWSTLLQKKSFAHGFSTSCPGDYESFDVKAAAQKGADNGWSNITFGMRATTETSTYTWHKFKASSAQLSFTYNRKPDEPTDGKSTPGGDCSAGGTGVTVGKTNIVLSAKGHDPDGNLSKLHFRFWVTGDYTNTHKDYLITPTSTGTATVTVPSTFPLTDKTLYSWDVRSEDSGGLVSTFFPPGSDPCRITIDASGPPQPAIESTDFPKATADGQTWAHVAFGSAGSVTFSSPGAAKFEYAFGTVGYTAIAADSTGTATVTALKPPHAGPTYLNVYAYDQYGNESARTDYEFYVPPRDKADSPGDTGGDGIPDLLVVKSDGNLYNCPGAPGGELYACMHASYTSDKKLDPAGYWYDANTGKAALITHYDDAYPGDGSTDLFAVGPDGKFWLYPGDGYGSFNVDQRLRIRLPDNAPDPSTWTQIKAVGDITGDKRPDLVLRAGTAFWTLSGYTGATFRTATLMNSDAWGRREIVNIADINGDSTPDLLWRNLDNGNMYVRHGKPGSVSGSVDLDSLKLAANSLDGDVAYGTGWTDTAVPTALGIPDVNGDGIPDMWVRKSSDGYTRIYYPSRTNTNAEVKIVLHADWNTAKAFG
ncbi:DNRLRE domain-containing protein [Streptomyces beihaiensis]|uniref:DNRLRE domain-containing protein n=1 Tax=Streptomyces beihaiensis TaxID=2984495 RepID=A0ABT3TZC5_9ACTN|nr:DNRLRE domain-containing protein [Streptomyces beihaiensis]MCX3062407.1 DNRLRE domain-containing protein [Streptomyces beihaiensis]